MISNAVKKMTPADVAEMDVETLIDTLNIKVHGIRTSKDAPVKMSCYCPEVLNEAILARVDEIKAALKVRDNKRIDEEAAYQAKIDAIDGLAEIRQAREALADWRRRWNASFDGDCGGLGVGDMPYTPEQISEMRKAHPRADAYLLRFSADYGDFLPHPRADAYLQYESDSYSANYTLSGIGKTALERVINGDDLDDIAAEYTAAKAAWAAEHMWD